MSYLLIKKSYFLSFSPCPFSNLFGETLFHIFYECDRIKCLWSDLVQYFENSLILPNLTQLSAIFVILGPLAMTPVLKTRKSLSITFYLHLNCTFTDPEKSNS